MCLLSLWALARFYSWLLSSMLIKWYGSKSDRTFITSRICNPCCSCTFWQWYKHDLCFKLFFAWLAIALVGFNLITFIHTQGKSLNISVFFPLLQKQKTKLCISVVTWIFPLCLPPGEQTCSVMFTVTSFTYTLASYSILFVLLWLIHFVLICVLVPCRFGKTLARIGLSCYGCLADCEMIGW